MGNFLSLAKRWGGYNPTGKPVPAPEPIKAQPKACEREIVEEWHGKRVHPQDSTKPAHMEKPASSDVPSVAASVPMQSR